MKPLRASPLPLLVVIYASVLRYLAQAVTPPNFPSIWSNMNCSNSDGTNYNWTFNSEGQTPCQVVEQLTSNCNFEFTSDTALNGVFPVDKQDGCLCNTIIFSLLSACVLCNPDGIIFSQPTWGEWLMTNNCTISNDTQAVFQDDPEVKPFITTSALHSPLPTRIKAVIPGWAFIGNISIDDVWPSDSAMEVAFNDMSPNSTILGPTVVITSISNGGPVSQIANKSQSPNTVLVGATLGSILGVVCVVFGAFLIIRSVRNQKRRRTQGNHAGIYDVTPFVVPVAVGQPPSNIASIHFPPSVEEDAMQVQSSDSVSYRRGSVFGNGENDHHSRLGGRSASPSIAAYHAPTEISEPPSYYATLPPNQTIPHIPRLPVVDLSH